MDINNLEIIIPAYNEEENISSVIEDIRKVLGRNCRIILVDDASEDRTGAIALQNEALVIRHPYRMGNGAAIKTGLRQASCDILVLMDADGQHPAQDLPDLIKSINSFDMVIGARSFTGFSLRNLANKFYNYFAGYVTRFDIRDLTSGYRVVKRKLALNFLYLLPNGFSYPTTLTLAFLRTGRSIKYINISKSLRKRGKSKIKPLKDGVKFLMIIARIATFFSPLRVFIPVSLLFFLTGSGYYLYTYLVYHRFTNMSALFFTTSVTIFMLGLISEQISQLRMDRTE